MFDHAVNESGDTSASPVGGAAVNGHQVGQVDAGHVIEPPAGSVAETGRAPGGDTPPPTAPPTPWDGAVGDAFGVVGSGPADGLTAAQGASAGRDVADPLEIIDTERFAYYAELSRAAREAQGEAAADPTDPITPEEYARFRQLAREVSGLPPEDEDGSAPETAEPRAENPGGEAGNVPDADGTEYSWERFFTPSAAELKGRALLADTKHWDGDALATLRRLPPYPPEVCAWCREAEPVGLTGGSGEAICRECARTALEALGRPQLTVEADTPELSALEKYLASVQAAGEAEPEPAVPVFVIGGGEESEQDEAERNIWETARGVKASVVRGKASDARTFLAILQKQDAEQYAAVLELLERSSQVCVRCGAESCPADGALCPGCSKAVGAAGEDEQEAVAAQVQAEMAWRGVRAAVTSRCRCGKHSAGIRDAPRLCGRCFSFYEEKALPEAVARAKAAEILRAAVAARSVPEGWEQADGPFPTLFDLLAEPEPERRFQVEGLAGQGHIITLPSARKSGKSTLIANLAQCGADGAAFLGRFATHLDKDKTVVIYNAEMERHDYARPFRLIGVAEPWRIHIEHLRGHRLPFLVDDQVAERLVARLKAQRCGWWILDPWKDVCSWNGVRPNLDEDVMPLMKRIQEIQAEAGIDLVILPAHTTQSPQEAGAERAKGAGAFEDSADALWRYTRADPSQGGASPRVLAVEGRGGVELEETVVEFDPTTLRLTLGSGDRRQMKQNGREERVLSYLMSLRWAKKPWPNTGELAAATGISDNILARDVLAPLEEAGKIIRTTGPRGAKIISLPDGPSSPGSSGSSPS